MADQLDRAARDALAKCAAVLEAVDVATRHGTIGERHRAAECREALLEARAVLDRDAVRAAGGFR